VNAANETVKSGASIWIVDSEQWPRASLRAELIERGYQAVGFVLLGEALETLRAGSSERNPTALIMESSGQQFSREALQELAGFRIPTLLLIGAAGMDQPCLLEYSWTAVLRRPVTIGEVVDRVEEIISFRRA
jgi:DNA-binding response OmpR family regulator